MQSNFWLQLLAGPSYKLSVGRYWSITHYVATLANGAQLNLLYRTGANSVSIVSEVAAGGNALIQTYEGATVTGANYGTPLTITNMNRAYAATIPALLVYHTPTLATTGSLMRQGFLAGGAGFGRQGSNLQAGTNWILKPSTIYLFRVTNLAGGGIAVSVGQEFCENVGG